MGIQSQDALAKAALSARERGVVERSVSRLRVELGPDLLAVWIYGSRARGEADPAETDPDLRSDIDLLAIVDPSRNAAKVGWDAHEWVEQEADAAGDSPVYYSMRVFDTDWLDDRRRIRSFFIQEVDRDKIVLYGDALNEVGQTEEDDR
jgi:predicted nucleotidyltransferase